MKTLADAVQAALEDLGLDEAALAQRKAFLGFTEADSERLRHLHPQLVGFASDLARRFYAHLQDFPETRRFIADPDVLTRLQQSQSSYFHALTAGDYGADYTRNRLRVGLAHQRIGLQTPWYLGAYAKYLLDLLPEFWRCSGHDPERFIASLQSLCKVVLLDIGLAVDAYIHSDRLAIKALRDYAELVFAAVPDGMVVLDAHLKVVAANPAFLRRCGVEHDAVLGQPVFSLIAAEGLRAPLDQVRHGGPALHDLPFELGLAHSAKRLPVRVTLTGLRIAQSEDKTRLLLTIEDVSEQSRLQQALQQSEATLLRAQEVAHIGSWHLDCQTGALSWSPEVYRIFCLPAQQPLTNTTFFNCVHPEDLEMVKAAWAAALQGSQYRIEHRIVSTGSMRWVEERAEFEFDAQGMPLRAVGTVQDISERKAAQQQIEHLAFYDPLTGLPNRTLFMDRLQHEIAAAARRGQKLSLLFLDLNRFKEINDTLGHEIGDRALQEVARRYRQALRSEETLARLSADEFAIIASGAGEVASRIAERIEMALSAPICINGQQFSVSTSIGIAVYPEDGYSAENMLKHADIAMYRAKSIGSGYCFYRSEMGSSLSRKIALSKRLELALAAGQLRLHYQPQVLLPGGGLIGAEALARWEDAEYGFVSPGEFIPLAEERGLISSLGEWALHEACSQVRRWQTMPGKVAVNVAAKQFDDDGFVEQALRIVREAQINPNLIELELTESGMMRDPQRAIGITQALAAAGFALSIDDFGTGHSSLAYLKRFPVNKIKIDISFVRDMLSDRNDHAIVSAIIAMSRSMGLQTLAEGVESPEQAEALLSLGCQMAQGYLFGRPQTATAIQNDWLQRRP